MKNFLSIAILACSIGVPAAISAVPSGNLGEEIAYRSYKQMQGFTDMKARISMITKRNNEIEENVTFRVYAREVGSDQVQRLTVVETPKDLQGVKFLTYSFNEAEDQQWIYMPRFKRVKRMANHSRSGNFMGSEFAFEDVNMPRPTQYSYEFQGEGVVDGRNSYAVVRRPNFDDSNYSYNVVWFDQESYLTQKIEFYDDKGELTKELKFNRYRKDDNHPWQAMEMVMENKKTGDVSKMVWEKMRYASGISDMLFAAPNLERVYNDSEIKDIADYTPDF